MKGLFFLLVLLVTVFDSVGGKSIPPLSSTVSLATNSNGRYIKAHSMVAKSRVYIGDKIRYKLILSLSPNVEVKLPQIKKDFKAFSLKDFGVVKRNYLIRRHIVYWYLLNTYTPGKYIIPEVEVKYKTKSAFSWHSLKTNPVTIEVASLLNKKINNIRDIKGPEGAGLSLILIIFIVVSMFAVIVDRKSTRLNSSHTDISRMPSSA